MRDFDLARFLIGFFVIAYSCVLHECAHVWVALKLGDSTGKMEGRLTLDPRPHIDIFWTVLLPLLTLLFASFPIGGPKPAPVNPLNFRDPRAGHMWTALAGPATNLLLAAAAFLALWAIRAAVPGLVEPRSYNAYFLLSVMVINLVLAALNLIPVPPLDGSRFLQFLLGSRADAVLWHIERLGVLAIFLAFYLFAPLAIRPFLQLLFVALVLVMDKDYAGELLSNYFRLG